ncbi:hypothetical protein AB0I77_21565 [Streptomyces sp. NPDC050619]|uniref:hypothetical protein n=1 Tax=Streptomyces sp. NPDC050619 TaxID=3157214 RepID=UPI00341FF167
MTDVFSHPDPACPAEDTEGSPATPKHLDLFLQPRYTVELPPLDEEEDGFLPPSAPAPRRHGVTRGR